MTTTHLYYLGPENTFSHTAAQRIQAQQPALQTCSLIPCATADDLFHHVLTDPHAGVIVPVFNLEQGVVYDFARFYLFEPQAEEKLSVQFGLFSQATSLEGVHKLITKDTVIPQISRWVNQLPPHIEIEATPYISTAASALRAAQEPHAAAVCAPHAGAIYPNLNLLADQLSNNPDSYTLFKLFVRPATYWHNSDLFAPPEYPHNMTDELAADLSAGRCTIAWRKSTRTPLHLGHYSNLLTLRKLASWGNRIQIVLAGGETAVSETLRQSLALFFGDTLPVTYTIIEPGDSLPVVDLMVAGIEHIHTFTDHPALFIDALPGTDGYAQMATGRNNTLGWIAPMWFSELPPLFAPHFSLPRVASAGLTP